MPIIVGPHTENFRDIVGWFRANDAVRVSESKDLSSTVTGLLKNDEERHALGRRALETLRSQQGATALTLDRLRIFLREREGHTA